VLSDLLARGILAMRFPVSSKNACHQLEKYPTSRSALSDLLARGILAMRNPVPRENICHQLEKQPHPAMPDLFVIPLQYNNLRE
jgi:sulfur transfer complex TusBCD TusB component (DsrH family)